MKYQFVFAVILGLCLSECLIAATFSDTVATPRTEVVTSDHMLMFDEPATMTTFGATQCADGSCGVQATTATYQGPVRRVFSRDVFRGRLFRGRLFSGRLRGGCN